MSQQYGSVHGCRSVLQRWHLSVPNFDIHEVARVHITRLLTAGARDYRLLR